MHKQFRIAIIVEVIVLLIASGFSVVYAQMGASRTGHIMDILLVMLWVIVAVALLLVFRMRSLAREEMVRRFYFSQDWVYNHEIGYAPLQQVVPDRDPYEFVTFAADSLAKMSYGFEIATAPDDFSPRYVISSKDFQYHLLGDDSDPDDVSAVIDAWTGSLQRIETDSKGNHVYVDVGEYSNARELAHLIDTEDAFKA